GTTILRPGEASLAHRGVLFLDELTEFHRDAIEALRQPLEDGRIVITRAGGSVAFPARFTLVAAANPCPCGFSGDPRKACRCRPDPLARREARLSTEAEDLIADAVEHMALTGRGFDRVIKVARTVADLEGAERVSRGHVAEALSYRSAFEGDQDLARAG